MSSFKFKLVAYFLVLSLLPLAAAFYGFSSVTKRSEERRVDARIQAGLRAALTAYGDELDEAQRQATELGRDRRVQDALRNGDRAALARIARQSGIDARFERRAELRLGPLSAARTVSVYAGGRLLGDVTVLVHLSNRLLSHIRTRTGLDEVDRVVAVRNRQIVLGDRGLGRQMLAAPTGRAAVVKLSGTNYRALAATPLTEPPGVSFVVLSPQGAAESAAAATQRRLLFALLASLVLIALVAYILSRSVVGRLRDLADAATAIAGGHLAQRVPVQGRDEFAALGRSFNDMAHELESRVDELEAARQRLREAMARFGETLEATHDPDQLRQVIVESAVEATGALGGVLESEGERVTAGDPEGGSDRLDIPLASGGQSFGRLILAGSAFDADSKETAASLAGQAVIALENARLHTMVERQALVDGLTGLANRRRSEEMLHLEQSRAERLGAPLAFVLADVDRFKKINDKHGHPVGDRVLREIANLLAETVREIDVAGRWGGEEFAVILPGTDLAGGAQLAERMRVALEESEVKADDGSLIPVTASFGVASFPENRTEADLVAAADAALYQAKRSGRNRVVAGGTVQPTVAPEFGTGRASS
jgi:diguanylate cyclase (GGDEF)-like protein